MCSLLLKELIFVFYSEVNLKVVSETALIRRYICYSVTKSLSHPSPVLPPTGITIYINAPLNSRSFAKIQRRPSISLICIINLFCYEFSSLKMSCF